MFLKHNVYIKCLTFSGIHFIKVIFQRLQWLIMFEEYFPWHGLFWALWLCNSIEVLKWIQKLDQSHIFNEHINVSKIWLRGKFILKSSWYLLCRFYYIRSHYDHTIRKTTSICTHWPFMVLLAEQRWTFYEHLYYFY